MPKAKANQSNATKSDLLRALAILDAQPSKRLADLQSKQAEAEAALEEFCKTNQEYIRLTKAVERLRRTRHDREHAERDERRQQINRARSEVLTLGVTTETVALVRATVKALSGG